MLCEILSCLILKIPSQAKWKNQLYQLDVKCIIFGTCIIYIFEKKRKPRQTIHIVLQFFLKFFFLELGSRCQVRVSVYCLYISRLINNLKNKSPPKKNPNKQKYKQSNKQKKTWRLYRSHADSTCNKSGRHIWSNLYFFYLNNLEWYRGHQKVNIKGENILDNSPINAQIQV